MAAQFVTIDRETIMLLPQDLREWVPEDSRVHFIIDAIDSLEIQGVLHQPAWLRQSPKPSLNDAGTSGQQPCHRALLIP